MNRYDKLFAKAEGAFVPFIMLSDPTPEDAVEIVSAVVDAGADAVELGVPFSDPVADGAAIQGAHVRALAGGATVDKALAQIRTIRSRYPELPIGMLVYGNVARAASNASTASSRRRARTAFCFPTSPCANPPPSAQPPPRPASTRSTSPRRRPRRQRSKRWPLTRAATSTPPRATA